MLNIGIRHGCLANFRPGLVLYIQPSRYRQNFFTKNWYIFYQNACVIIEKKKSFMISGFSLFCDVTQSRLAVGYRSFGTKYFVPFSRCKQFFLDCLVLKDGTDRLSEHVHN
jgi:hypothetical protein